MPKKGTKKTEPLSEASKFFIRENCRKLSVADMVPLVRASEEEIQKYIEEVGIDNSKPNKKERSDMKEIIRKAVGDNRPSGKLMGHDKERGVVVMTEASSELSDEHKKDGKYDRKPRDTSGHIHRIDK